MKSIAAANRGIRVTQYVIALLVLFVIAVPLYISVIGGLKTVGQLRAQPAALPHPAVWSQYADMLTGVRGSFWLDLWNSLVVGAGTVGVVLIASTTAGYALARLKFRLSKLFYAYFLLGLLFPLAVAILPLYVQLRYLGLIDTQLGVILAQAAFGLAMMVLLLHGFFRQIPKELEEAAAMDGYGPFGFLFRIVVPLSTPILATVSILTLVASWNSFFTPLLVLNTPTKFTLPLGVMDFMGQYAADWNRILAFLTLAMIPALVLYIFGQKYIVAGLTGGAVKG